MFLTGLRPTGLDDVFALPCHGNDRAGGEVGAEAGVEGQLSKASVVVLGLLKRGRQHLEADEPECKGQRLKISFS